MSDKFEEFWNAYCKSNYVHWPKAQKDTAKAAWDAHMESLERFLAGGSFLSGIGSITMLKKYKQFLGEDV